MESVINLDSIAKDILGFMFGNYFGKVKEGKQKKKTMIDVEVEN